MDMETDEDRHRRRFHHGFVVEEEAATPPQVDAPKVNIGGESQAAEEKTIVKPAAVCVGVSHATPGQDQ